MHFAAIDWFIVVAYLILSVAAGLLGKKYIGNVSHYLVAGRELGMYAGIATLAATEIGTITFMYNGELGYKYGFAAFAAALISGLVMIVVGRTGLVVERFRSLRLMTVPEYFERKYSRGLRLLAGILVATGGILNMGVFLKIEGEFLTIVSGIDSRYLVGVMTAILLLELVYTVVGGMMAVVITDFIQYAMLSVATILVSIYAVYHAGWDNIVSKIFSTCGVNAGSGPSSKVRAMLFPKRGPSHTILGKMVRRTLRRKTESAALEATLKNSTLDCMRCANSVRGSSQFRDVLGAGT